MTLSERSFRGGVAAYLALQQCPSHTDTVLQLLALAVALRLRLHAIFALVGGQYVQLVLEPVLQLVALHFLAFVQTKALLLQHVGNTLFVLAERSCKFVHRRTKTAFAHTQHKIHLPDRPVVLTYDVALPLVALSQPFDLP